MNCLTLKQQGTKCLCFVASHVTNGEQHCVFVKEFIRIFWLPTDSGRYSTVTPKLILIMPCFLSLSAGIMPCDPMAVNSTKGNKMQRNFPKHKFQSKCNYVCCNNFPERGGKGTPLKRVRMWGSCVAHMYALASICSAWIVRRKFSSSSSLLACKSNNKVRKESYPCSEGNTNSKELQTKLELAAKKICEQKRRAGEADLLHDQGAYSKILSAWHAAAPPEAAATKATKGTGNDDNGSMQSLHKDAAVCSRLTFLHLQLPLKGKKWWERRALRPLRSDLY